MTWSQSASNILVSTRHNLSYSASLAIRDSYGSDVPHPMTNLLCLTIKPLVKILLYIASQPPPPQPKRAEGRRGIEESREK